MRQKHKWYVITGGPSSGKTTIIHKLAHLGYRIIPEMARSVIERELRNGKNIKVINHEEKHVQKMIMTTQLNAEKRTPRDQIVFLDRGMPDSVAYYRLHHLDARHALKMSRNRPYAKVFLFDLLSYQYDGVRVENATIAKKIDQLIEQAYRELGYELVRVPVLSINDRVKFVLKHLR